MAEQAEKTEESKEQTEFDPNSPDVQALVRKAVESEVNGLKAKNSELLGKLKTAQEQAARWEGFEPDQVKSILDRFDKDEEMKLIKEGRVDEAMQRRNQKWLDTYNKQREQLEAKLAEAQKTGETYQQRFRRHALNSAVANEVTGTEEGALPHVQRLVADWFDVDDNGNPQPTDRAPLDEKGEPLSFKKLKAYLIETSPFFFPRSSGAGMQPGGKNRSEKTINRQQYESLSHPERKRFFASGGKVVD